MVKKNILGLEITMMMKVKSIYEFYKNSVKEYKLNIMSEIRYSTESISQLNVDIALQLFDHCYLLELFSA